MACWRTWYFGWPRAHEDDAERAVRSALAVTAGGLAARDEAGGHGTRGEEPANSHRHRHRHDRLARTATEAIVARITRGKRLPEALLDEIAARTDGVPLFVELMTKAVIVSGVLREDADAYHVDGR